MAVLIRCRVKVAIQSEVAATSHHLGFCCTAGHRHTLFSLPLSTLFFQGCHGLMHGCPATRLARLPPLSSHHTAARSPPHPPTFENCLRCLDALGIDCLLVHIFVALSAPWAGEALQRGDHDSALIPAPQDCRKNPMMFKCYLLTFMTGGKKLLEIQFAYSDTLLVCFPLWTVRQEQLKFN